MSHLSPMNRDTGMKTLELPSALSRHNFSTITKDIESTESSFARALPRSLEPRKESFVRPASLPRESVLPKHITDADLAVYDVHLTTPNKRSQIRANLHSGNTKQSVQVSDNSPIKAKRFSKAPSLGTKVSSKNQSEVTGLNL